MSSIQPRAGRLVILLLLLALIAAACGADESPEPAPEAAPDEAEPEDASEEDFPTRPIELVVPWAPGGTSTLIGQSMASQLSDILGVRVNVVNREGASGRVGTLAVKDADPDGHTILQAWVAPMVVVPLAEEDPGYDPLEDFEMLAWVSEDPVMLVARSDRGWNDASDFLQDAEENPGQFVWSGGGELSVHTLTMRALLANEGIEAEGVIYESATAALPDLLGGAVDVSSANAGMLARQPEELVGLVVYADDRHPAAPDVPTAAELGLDAPTVPGWSGVAVRSDTPDHIKQILADAVREAVLSDAFQQEMEDAGLVIRYEDTDTARELLRRSLDQLEEPVQRAAERED